MTTQASFLSDSRISIFPSQLSLLTLTQYNQTTCHSSPTSALVKTQTSSDHNTVNHSVTISGSLCKVTY